ncbi:MAG: hypothetical protein Greene071421_405 [Parcubacteria group bacterium Greene0714_21]|nr:MAG: hypothetical protein Greene041639_58 [Parcubacteria group bacterium Greene0416_39]TSD04039.1 MAG: hypothetical protein Greene071421_405 [Parcubacteria group bacterium Greene0714_21]
MTINLRRKKLRRGFGLIELLVTIGIVAILGAIALPVSHYLEEDAALGNTAKEIAGTLQLAQSKTLASEGADSYGVFFDTNASTYTFFKGANFSQRDTASDVVSILPKSIEFSSVTFPAGEVVFTKITGFPNSAGSLGLGVKQRPQKTQSVFLGSSGEINTLVSSIPSDLARVKDSRHMHIAYAGRTIATVSETLKITFPNQGSPVFQSIVIANNLVQGQIFWEGSVNVGVQAQKLKIHTHFLNDPVNNTLFSIHRDKRFNTKGFFLELSGDSSGNVITYDDQGQTTKGTSIYVSSPELQ